MNGRKKTSASRVGWVVGLLGAFGTCFIEPAHAQSAIQRYETASAASRIKAGGARVQVHAPIEVVEEGLRHSVRIGDAIDFEVEDIVPFGIETGEPARLVGVFHPAGSELTAAEATRSQISAFGIEYEGKTGLSAPFAWAA